MLEPVETFWRAQLLDRRQKLESTIPVVQNNVPFLRLLHEVDAALSRMNDGTYGLCEVCQGEVEEERLRINPFLTRCLDCLSPEQKDDLEQDLDMAGRIQSELLPKPMIKIEPWEVSYHYEAVGPVSGDYCDVLTTPDGELIFLMGDVSGKGIASSMLMAHLHGTFRSLISVGLPFEQLMEKANRLFCSSTMPAFFATLVCGKAGKSGEIELFNAGHCPPLWIRRGRVEVIEATGLPLGMFCSSPYQLRRIMTEPGDSILLYTDGLTEARNGLEEEYGSERLMKIAQRSRALTPQVLVSACLSDVAAFRSGAPNIDDLSAMAVRRQGG